MVTSFDAFFQVHSCGWLQQNINIRKHKLLESFIFSVCIIQPSGAAVIIGTNCYHRAPNATLNWALCVSPGLVRAGSLVSMKGSSYSVKRELWWGFFFSPGSLSLSVQCNCHSAAPNQRPWSLPKLDRQEHKRWKYWTRAHLSIHTIATLVRFSWDRIELQKHVPCLSRGCDWLNNQANKNWWPLLLRVSEETRTSSPWNVQYFCPWWWSYTGTHL